MRSNRNLTELGQQIDLSTVETIEVWLPCNDQTKQKFNVPKFLYDAFEYIKKNGGYETEGIFRKQGNNARVEVAEVAFTGRDPIPSDCTPLDVAVLIKRFLSRIKGGIFGDKEKEMQIINSKTDKYGGPLKSDAALFQCAKTVPHLPTLAYLMFSLRRVAKHHESNRMDSTNLATVFVPSLFVHTTFESFPGEKAQDINTGIRTISAIVVVLIEKSVELATLPAVIRQNYGEHVPLSLKGGYKEAISKSNRIHNPYTTESPDPFNDLAPSKYSSNSHGNMKFSSERESRSTSKSTNKRRGSSVIRSAIDFLGVGKNLFSGRRSSNVGTSENTAIRGSRKNNSSGELTSKNSAYVGRCSSFKVVPNKPTISAPLEVTSFTKNELQRVPRQKSAACVSSTPNLVDDLSKSPAKSSPLSTPKSSPPKENIQPSSSSEILEVPKKIRLERRDSKPLERKESKKLDRKESKKLERRESKKLEKMMELRANPIQRTSKEKLRRQTAPMNLHCLKRHQPNSMHSGLKNIKRRGSSFSTDRNYHDENFSNPVAIAPRRMKNLTRGLSKNSIAPELKDGINEAFIKQGYDPMPLKERTASTANSQHDLTLTTIPQITNDENDGTLKNVQALIRKFDKNVGMQRS